MEDTPSGIGSLLTALGGALGNTAGVVYNRPGAGQPLTTLSQQLAHRDQDIINNTIAHRRQLKQEEQQEFYRKQSEKSMSLNEAKYANTLAQQKRDNTLQDAASGRQIEQHKFNVEKAQFDLLDKTHNQLVYNAYLPLAETLTGNKQLLFRAKIAKGDYTGANALLVDKNLMTPIDLELKNGTLLHKDIPAYIEATYGKPHWDGIKTLAKSRYFHEQHWLNPRSPIPKEEYVFKAPASGQPQVYDYNVDGSLTPNKR